MLRFCLIVLIIAIFNSILEYIIPFWWILSIPCFIGAYFYKVKPIINFFSAAWGIILSWFVMMIYRDLPTQFLMPKKMSLLFPLGGSVVLFYLVTLVIGGLVGGLSGLCGSYFRILCTKKK